MPHWLEESIKKSARKKGIKTGTKRMGAYLWGTMRKIKSALKRKGKTWSDMKKP